MIVSVVSAREKGEDPIPKGYQQRQDVLVTHPTGWQRSLLFSKERNTSL